MIQDKAIVTMECE